jgi:hypothetical protein
MPNGTAALQLLAPETAPASAATGIEITIGAAVADATIVLCRAISGQETSS